MIRKLKHKFHAKRCEVDNKKFPSQLEKNCYLELKKLHAENKILFFLMQVPFHLPGGKKHIVDFMVFTQEDVILIESKGRDLPLGKLKRDQVKEIYNVELCLAHSASDIKKILSSKNIV